MCLGLLKIVWVDICIGFLVFNVCYGSLHECRHSDNLSLQGTAVLGSEFELPLCWQLNDYNHTFTSINNNEFVKINENTKNVWIASRVKSKGHNGYQEIVFMINRVRSEDIKNHQVTFHPYGNWTTIHVNVTKSNTRVTKPASTELNEPESIVSESTATGSTVTGSAFIGSTNINKSESVCENDWQYIENRCVKLFKAANWSAAVTTCQKAGAKLTNGLFNRSVYKQDTATWINKKTQAKCYLQEKKNTSLETDCSESHKYFCEKTFGGEGKCKSAWQQVEDTCIQYFDQKNWKNAFYHCKNISAELTNGTLDYEMYSQVSSSPTWINQSSDSFCYFMKKKNTTTTKALRCNETRTFFCEKSQDPPNVTHFNLQTNLLGEGNASQDLLNAFLELIPVNKQAHSLMFTCNASGAHNVTIIKDKEIKATGINYVKYQQSLSQQTLCFDSGEYSCVAHNKIGVSKISRKIQETCQLQIESFSATTKIDDNLFIAEVNDTGFSFQCTTNRVFYPFLKLQYKGKRIADSVTTNVNYTIPQVQCHHVGEYVCKAENTRTNEKQEKTIQLAVSNCKAQLCSTIDQSKTIKAKVHENVTASFCLIIYQDHFKEPKLYLNETVIEQTELFNRYSWSLDTYGHLNKTVNLYIHDIKPEDFGLQYINIEFNGYNTSLLLDIQPEGPPLCPTNLTIQETGSNYISLSWTPGFNGGAEQTFLIVYKELNETSQPTREVNKTSMDSLGRMNVTVDNLEPNKSYEFRVTSSNRFGYQIEESSLCHVTTTGTTRTGAESLVQQESKADLHIGAMAVAGVAVVVIIVALVVVVIKKRGIRPGQRKIIETKEDGNEYDGLTNVYANMSSSPKQEETNTELIVSSEAGDHTLEGDRNSGRYVSDQGLVYVTLVHTQSIKKPPRKGSVKKEVESVEYVTIDHVRTGQQQGEDLDKEEKSEVKGSENMELVDISNTAGNENPDIERDSAEADKSLESCQVDNKDDAKLLG